MVAYIKIIFDKKYEFVELHLDNNILKFDTGDFIKDWFYCMKKVIFTDGISTISNSSSVDHFIMDFPYSSAYLHMENNKGVLKYINRENNFNISDYHISEGTEFFVNEGDILTWDELKEYCKL